MNLIKPVKSSACLDVLHIHDMHEVLNKEKPQSCLTIRHMKITIKRNTFLFYCHLDSII